MSAALAPTNRPARSIAESAVATGFFERIRIFSGSSSIVLSHALAQHAGSQMFHALGVTVTVRNHVLENVVLDGDSLILFQDGVAILETAYFEPPNALRQLPDLLELAPVPDNADVVYGYNNAHAGYQHWLTQCIPAIDWSLRQQRTRDVLLLLPRLEPWQEDFLTLLGYGGVPRLTPRPGVRYRLPHVEFSEYLNGTTSFAVCLSMTETARRIAAAVASVPSDEKVIYVKARNPYYGSIRNEGPVIDLLRQRGVIIVESAAIGTAERINMFRNADAVIGPLGQGLSDIVFCRAGALLWEWMPRHHQNASFNRLAQAAQVDYWGDLFEAAADPAEPGQWEVDLGIVGRRLTELSVRLAHRNAVETPSVPIPGRVASRPIDDLMLDFESLGDNCEFGLVQRHAGTEPLGLLRFNGFFVPPEFRLGKLVAALEKKFNGLGAPGTITVFPDGIAGQRELIVRESVYEFWYHTGIAEGAVPVDVQTDRETTRLSFLRRKLLEDLKTGDKTWVWKSQATTDRDEVQPLLDALRKLGPNTLLWVVEADGEHAAGTIEPLERDFIKGYVSRFAPYEAVANIDVASWLVMCWRADEFRHPDSHAPQPKDQPELQPASAIEFLMQNPAVAPEIAPAAKPGPGLLSGALAWWRRRFT
jgi:hypothetical protein